MALSHRGGEGSVGGSMVVSESEEEDVCRSDDNDFHSSVMIWRLPRGKKNEHGSQVYGDSSSDCIVSHSSDAMNLLPEVQKIKHEKKCGIEALVQCPLERLKTEHDDQSGSTDCISSGSLQCIQESDSTAQTPPSIDSAINKDITQKRYKYKTIDKNMQIFLRRYYSFCEDSFDESRKQRVHGSPGKSFLVSLPSFIRNNYSETSQLFNPTDYQIPCLKPMKKHLRKCGKRYGNLEKLTNLLQRSRRDAHVNIQWAAAYLNIPSSNEKTTADAEACPGVAAGPLVRELKKDMKVEVGMPSRHDCPGTIVKKLKYGTYLVEVSKNDSIEEEKCRLRVPHQLLRPWREREEELGKSTISSRTYGNSTAAINCGTGITSRDNDEAICSGRGTRGSNITSDSMKAGCSGGMLTVGTLVQVAERTWSNMNKPGGTGLITHVFVLRDDEEDVDSDDDDYRNSSIPSKVGSTVAGPKYCYNIRYPVGGREQRVHQRYVTATSFLDRAEKRRDMLGRCRVPYCPSFISDCGHTQPGGKIDKITERLVQKQNDRNVKDQTIVDSDKLSDENIASKVNFENNAPSEPKVKRKKLVPMKDAVRKKTCSLQRGLSFSKFEREAFSSRKKKRFHNNDLKVPKFKKPKMNTENSDSMLDVDDDKPYNNLPLTHLVSYELVDDNNGYEVDHGADGDDDFGIVLKISNEKKKNMSLEEKISFCESILGQLKKSNKAFEKNYINRVQKWIDEFKRVTGPRKGKSVMHSKLNHLETKCTKFKLLIQRELNDVLDRHLRKFENIKRSSKEEYGGRIALLEVQDAAAQEKFKVLIERNKQVCEMLRSTLGSQYTDIADSESSSDSDSVRIRRSEREIESDSDSGSDGDSEGDINLLNHEGRKGKSSDGMSSDMYIRRHRPKKSNYQFSAPASNSHSRSKSSSNDSGADKNLISVSSQGLPSEVIDMVSSANDSDDNDNYSDSMDDFIDSDDDHFCKYSKVKKHSMLNGPGKSKEFRGGSSRNTNTPIVHERAGSICEVEPPFLENRTKFSQHSDCDSFDDKLKKLLHIFDSEDTNMTFLPLRHDMLFSCCSTNIGGFPPLWGNSTDNSYSIEFDKAISTRSAAQGYLASIIEKTKNEVDIQNGNVLTTVIHELFSNLTASFMSQVAGDSFSIEILHQQLFALDALWTQHCCQQLSCCKSFLKESEQLEVCIIMSPLFTENVQFNLFTLLRRKAMWIKIGMHCASRTVFYEGDTAESSEMLKVLMFTENKLFSQVFLGFATYSSFGLVASYLCTQVKTTSHVKNVGSGSTTAYLSDLIGTLCNMSRLHPMQHKQWSLFFPLVDLTGNGNENGQDKFSWKEFNIKLLSFLSWFSSVVSVEKSRSRMFSTLNHDYYYDSDIKGSSPAPATTFRTSSIGVAESNAKDFNIRRKLSNRTEQLIWLVIVVQSIVFASNEVSSKSLSQSTLTPTLKITSNWVLMSSLVKENTTFSDNLVWINRLLSILPLWKITTDAYDMYQDILMKMLRHNLDLSGSSCDSSGSLLPWNEASLLNLGQDEIEIEKQNNEFDESNDQLLHMQNMEKFVKSFTSGYFNNIFDINTENVEMTSVQMKIDTYRNWFVEKWLGNYFAFFNLELPLTSDGIFSLPDVMDIKNTSYSSKPYGCDCFMPVVCSFDSLLDKICSHSEKANLMRLKPRIIRPKTGVLKLFAENRNFSTAIISIYQASLCINKFGASEAFTKLGILKTFSFLNDSNSSKSGVSNTSLTKVEQNLLLWYAIVIIYLPLLLESCMSSSSFSQPLVAASQTACATPPSSSLPCSPLKHAERLECFQLICKGFDTLWTNVYEQATFKQNMLNQNIASGAMVLLTSIVLYDGIRLQFKSYEASLSSADPLTVLTEKEVELVNNMMQKIMDNLFNGLQLKQDVLNGVCISLLQNIADDVYDVVHTSFHTKPRVANNAKDTNADLPPQKLIWIHVVNMFFDMHTQLRLLKNLHQILLSLLNNDEPETAFTRKAGEHRRDGTLSSVPNLCCESNQSWKQALSIIDFASKLYLTLLLSEEPSLATLLKSNNKGDGLKDLKQLRLSVINIIVEGFPAADDDNVTCVDLWLKCAFWSRILSKVLHWIQFNIGGKGVLIKRVFTIALLDASMANGTDIFSIWAGTLATACLQPKLLTEIGFLSLHNAMQTSIILQCIPTKYAFLTRCMSCMASLRKVNLPHYLSTETLSEPSSSDNRCTSGKLSLPGATTPVVNDEESQVLTIDWQLFTLHRFAMLSAVQLNDLRPEQRSDVKERQFKPVIDMLHRCVRSLEDRLKYTSSTMQHILRRAIHTIFGRILGGVLVFASVETCLLDLYSSYHLLSLLEVQNYSISVSTLNRVSAPDIKVCLLLRMLPLYIAGISFTKYSTTFFSTWTPLLFMLPSTRAISLRKIREFITHLWALSLLNPFDSSLFTQFVKESKPSDNHVSLRVSLPYQLQQVYADACQIVNFFPTALDIAKFENPMCESEYAVSSSLTATTRAAIPTKYGAPASASKTYVANTGSTAGLSRESTTYLATTNATSFLVFQQMWKSRMQGFCEYVLCNDSLWQGRDHLQSSSAASDAQWRASSTAARIDLILEIINILCQQSCNDFRRVEVEGRKLLLKIRRHVMYISLILCGRILRYILGDGVPDIICEDIDVPQQLTHVDSAVVDQICYHLFLCQRVVSDVCEEASDTRAGGVVALSKEEILKWKKTLKVFCDVVTPDIDQSSSTIDLVGYHSSLSDFISIHEVNAFRRVSPPALFAEEVKRHTGLLQPQSRNPLTLRRNRTETMVKTAKMIQKALV